MTDRVDNSLPGTADTAASHPRRLPLWVMIAAFVVLGAFMWLIGWGLSRTMRGTLQIGDPAPVFTMTTFDGQTINSADLTGKIVVLNFWASWCKPCEAEARELEEVYQRYKPDGDVVFLGLAYVDTEPNSLAYLKKFGVTYPNGPDLATKVSQMFRVSGVPETFVIDREGKLSHFKSGPFMSAEEIIAAVEAAK